MARYRINNTAILTYAAAVTAATATVRHRLTPRHRDTVTLTRHDTTRVSPGGRPVVTSSRYVRCRRRYELQPPAAICYDRPICGRRVLLAVSGSAELVLCMTFDYLGSLAYQSACCANRQLARPPSLQSLQSLQSFHVSLLCSFAGCVMLDGVVDGTRMVFAGR